MNIESNSETNKINNSIFEKERNSYSFPFQNEKEFLFSLFDKNLDTRKILNKAKQIDILNPDMSSSSEYRYLIHQFRNNYVFLLTCYIDMYKELLRFIQSNDKSARKLNNHLNRFVLISQSLFRIFLHDSMKYNYTSIQAIFGKMLLTFRIYFGSFR
jgi:hypothetical protein